MTLNVIGTLRHENLTFADGEKLPTISSRPPTRFRAYFCDWHSAWPCSTFENINSLLLYHLPKSTGSLVNIWEELDAVGSLNSRPRAIYNGRSPLHVSAGALATSYPPDTELHHFGGELRS